uniref:GB1/RHD3-type G domain-containing protein n=1 Tax=Globodera rostochiensis TaxID=31243 RepID=A0A914I3C9_GLORO
MLLSCNRRQRRRTPPASVRRSRRAVTRALHAATCVAPQQQPASDQPALHASAGQGAHSFSSARTHNAWSARRRAATPITASTTTASEAAEDAHARPRENWKQERAAQDAGDDEAEANEESEQYAEHNRHQQQFIYYKPNFVAIERGAQCQMENRNRIRPVQLFVPSSSNPNVLKLNKGGLNAVLGHASIANRKIVVISMAGAYRKGKSLLLNFFLDYLYKLQYTQKNQELELEEWITDDDIVEGFLYKSGPKRCTAGIWIWAEPILIDIPNGERYAVLLMDTQGCYEQQNNSNGTGNTTTNSASSGPSGCANMTSAPALLALSTMLSSVQCYTTAEGIPDEALALLSCFVDYGKLASAEAKEFGKPYQRLACLIRDFKLTDEMIYGVEGGNRLLEKVLSSAPENHLDSKASASERKNAAIAPLAEVRRHIRQCFEHGISCYLMPHPGPKVAEPNSGFRGQVKDIKLLFRDEVKRLVESLVAPNVLKPKVLNGRPVTVRKFVECVREYARIFDSAVEVPNARAILNANLQLACVDYAMEAKVAYCRAMDRATRSSRMMAEKKLLEAHIKHGIKALNIYDRCPKIYSGDVRNNNLARLQESINHELERYQRLNEEKRVTTCASAMLACGDSPLFGVGLGGAASGAVAATVLTLQMGVVSAGIVAIPVSLTALFGIWVYVTLKPTVKSCLGLEKDN